MALMDSTNHAKSTVAILIAVVLLLVFGAIFFIAAVVNAPESGDDDTPSEMTTESTPTAPESESGIDETPLTDESGEVDVEAQVEAIEAELNALDAEFSTDDFSDEELGL